MSDALPTDPPPRDPTATRGTPRRPDLPRRRGVFVALLVAYLLVVALLIWMSVRQHA